MFSPLCKILLRQCSQIAAPQHNNLFDILLNKPFPISFRFISTASDHHSFTTSYLVNKCGLTLESASSASKYVSFKNPQKPDSVLAFLRRNGLSDPQISSLVRKKPVLLHSDPQKTLLPKVEFLRSRGLSSAEIASTLSNCPHILLRSLKKQIIPVFDFLSNMVQSDEAALCTFNRYKSIILKDVDALLLPNISTLRENGVPESNISKILKLQPRMLARVTPAKFRETVGEIKNMGFNPSKFTFVSAVCVANALSKSTMKRKFRAYGKWGWSEEDCLAAFRRFPQFLMSSEDKIMRVMDFFVNRLGCHSSCIARRPNVVVLSMERRIVPRGLLLLDLLSKGLVKAVTLKSFEIPEKLFLKRFVYHFKEESSELLKLYQETLNLPR